MTYKGLVVGWRTSWLDRIYRLLINRPVGCFHFKPFGAESQAIVSSLCIFRMCIWAIRAKGVHLDAWRICATHLLNMFMGKKCGWCLRFDIYTLRDIYLSFSFPFLVERMTAVSSNTQGEATSTYAGCTLSPLSVLTSGNFMETVSAKLNFTLVIDWYQPFPLCL